MVALLIWAFVFHIDEKQVFSLSSSVSLLTGSKIFATMLTISDSPADMTTNAVLMTITGFFIGGVANLVSAAVSADLGESGFIY